MQIKQEGKRQQLTLTCFKNLQVAKLEEVVAIVEVCDVNFIVARQRILHPRSLVPAVRVVSYWLRDGCQGVLALPCESQMAVSEDSAAALTYVRV